MKHISVVVLLICHVLVVRAQSPEDARWSENFGANGILYESSGSGDSPVSSVLIDGSDIYVGGKFTITGSGILKWDMNTGRWKQLDRGVTGTVTLMCRWNDYIVVSGNFTEVSGIAAKNLALWNTKSERWETLGKGIDGQVNSMAVFLGELYVGGNFSGINGKTVNGIARWNGTEWNTLGNGVYYGSVQALCVYNNELWVGGNFEAADGDKSKAKLAIWSGGSWKSASGFALASVWSTYVKCLAVVDDKLFVTGYWYWDGIILNNGTLKKSVPQLVAYDGSKWSEPVTTFGVNTSQYVPIIASNANELVVAFPGLDEVNGISAKGIAKWNSQSDRWSAFGSGLSSGTQYAYTISAISTDGNIVVVGGSFAEAGGEFVNNLALFSLSEQRWKPFASSSTNGLVVSEYYLLSKYPPLLKMIDNLLVAVGPFVYAGEYRVNSLAQWKGATWTPLGTGIQGGISNRKISSLFSIQGYISTLGAYDGGIIVAGDYSGIGGVTASCLALYKNSTFAEFGGGVNGAFTIPGNSTSELSVECILVDGKDVYIGGTFQNAGGKLVNNIARWDGTQWNDLGGGVQNNGQTASAKIYCIKKMPDGRIIVGGAFTKSGNISTRGLAVWNGTSWGLLGTIDSMDQVSAIRDIEFDGKDVYIGGYIKTIEGKYVRNIARWDGLQWNEVSGGVSHALSSGMVLVMKKYGNKLYVGGSFNVAGQTEAKNVAVWDLDNKKWSALGSGLRNNYDAGFVNSIVGVNDTVFFGGLFDRAGTTQTVNVAAWLPLSATNINTESVTDNTNGVTIYPNPADNVIHISFDEIFSSYVKISVYDALGRKISEINRSYDNHEMEKRADIDIGNLMNGAYSIRVENENSVKTALFVVQR